MAIEPHIARWWDIANERRGRLIFQKHMKGGLSERQELEFALLQGVTELIMCYEAPVDLRPLEALERKVRRLSKRISKKSLKYRDQVMKDKGGK